MSDEPANSAPPRRRVRSFVRRAGRVTPAQRRALEEHWPRFGLDAAARDGAANDAAAHDTGARDTAAHDSLRPLDLDALFGRRAPRVLEIGFGNGETLLALASAHPERDFIGIEVHEPGVGHALLRAAELDLRNLRISRDDAVEVLERQVPDTSIAEALVFFPDPWPKSRHHKRRLIQPPFAALLARKLEPGGVLRAATDWENYAEQILEVLSGCAALVNCAADGGCVPRPQSRPPTRFELRGQRLGHDVRDFAFRRL